MFTFHQKKESENVKMIQESMQYKDEHTEVFPSKKKVQTNKSTIDKSIGLKTTRKQNRMVHKKCWHLTHLLYTACFVMQYFLYTQYSVTCLLFTLETS